MQLFQQPGPGIKTGRINVDDQTVKVALKSSVKCVSTTHLQEDTKVVRRLINPFLYQTFTSSRDDANVLWWSRTTCNCSLTGPLSRLKYRVFMIIARSLL